MPTSDKAIVTTSTEVSRPTIQQRQDSATGWTTDDPVLAAGEIGFELDTGKFKIGDGVTAWTSLGYAALPFAGGTLTGDLSVPDSAYDATGWNGSAKVPTRNAVRDQFVAERSTSDADYVPQSALPETLVIVVGDETTDITTGTAKITFRMPFAMTLTEVRSSLNTASSSGIPTVDVQEGGVSIFSTLLTIDEGAKTSTTATVPAVISDSTIADDAEVTIDITVAGTGAKGLKVVFIGTRAV